MAGGPGSHLLAAAARANALALVPAGGAELPAGTPVELLLLD
jgi:molybdopterin molybdotransferase